MSRVSTIGDSGGAEDSPTAATAAADAATAALLGDAAVQTTRVDPVALLGQFVQVADIPHQRRVFCNRNLRMDEIETIGFDMDYTLAIYKQRHIETLSVECTLEKLVAKRGYPEEVLKLDYDPATAIRGLVVDRRYGNVFKMDRYGHVERVYHGHRPLEREERRQLYQLQRIRLSTPRYAWIDTLFALPEAVMFARIVEHFESQGKKFSFGKLWQDIRDCIDEAHRDESMKRVIKAHLAEYLERDPLLAPTLHKFRSAGKRLFLLTNSYWDYTDKLMSWLLDGQLAAYPTWRSYFDIVVVGAQKPAFFTERRPFVEVDGDGNPKRAPFTQGPLLRNHIYQGGNVIDFDAILGGGGDRVLYIGDHIYGDMLRAKKSSVWRTAMVVQELEDELTVADATRDKTARIEDLERRRIRLDSELSYQQQLAKSLSRLAPGQSQATAAGGAPVRLDDHTLEQARAEVRANLERLRAALREASEEVVALDQEVDASFNRIWGQLFKVGVENSRFGEQVEDYACLYTSRVSNFLSYSPLRYFRSPRDHMPHEM